MPFDWGLELVQDVICLSASFDWGLKAVRECLSYGPGSQHDMPYDCLFRFSLKVSVEAKGFVTHFLFLVSFV